LAYKAFLHGLKVRYWERKKSSLPSTSFSPLLLERKKEKKQAKKKEALSVKNKKSSLSVRKTNKQTNKQTKKANKKNNLQPP